MDRQTRARMGVQAGLFAGAVVATTFFFLDLAQPTMLATPTALGCSFLGPCRMSFDNPLVIESVTVISLAGRLTALTLLHLLVFSALGVGVVALCHYCRVSLNVLTGALYGLVACSLVFYTATWLTNAANLVVLPSVSSVLLVNLLAGAVMGGYFQWATRVARHAT